MKNSRILMCAVLAMIVLISAGCGKQVKELPKSVAVVNGATITASDLLEESYRRVGKQVLTGMIEREILLQWAKDEGVPVEDKQVAELIESSKREGNYNDQVEIVGEAMLRLELQSVQAKINIAKKEGNITEEQLKEAYKQLTPLFVHGPQKQIEAVISQSKESLEKYIKDVESGMSPKEAAMKNNVALPGSSGPRKMWMDIEREGETPEISAAMKSTAVGETTKILTITPPEKDMPEQYLVFKVLDERGKEDKTYEQAKTEVENMVCQQAFQMDPGIHSKFTEKKKEAKITISDKNLSDVVYSFKYPDDMSSMMGGGMPGMVPMP